MRRKYVNTLKKIALSVLIALLIEIVCFNWSPLISHVRNTERLRISADELSYVNWTEADGGRVSLQDAMIIKEGLSILARTMTIHLTAQPQPAAYTVFYTEGVGEAFSENRMITVPAATGEATVALDKQISAIRIDPGEGEGVLLQDVSISFNDVPWDISLARLIAMLIVWWGTKLLMSLQKAPDYEIDQEEGGAKE